jgi:hypothetical protein
VPFLPDVVFRNQKAAIIGNRDFQAKVAADANHATPLHVDIPHKGSRLIDQWPCLRER